MLCEGPDQTAQTELYFHCSYKYIFEKAQYHLKAFLLSFSKGTTLKEICPSIPLLHYNPY